MRFVRRVAIYILIGIMIAAVVIRYSTSTPDPCAEKTAPASLCSKYQDTNFPKETH